MLLSMTGFGRATQTIGGKTFSVEIRSLNSKQNDIRLRSNYQLHQFEMKLRRTVLDVVKRGKLEMTVEISDESGGGASKVNTNLLNQLYGDVMNGLYPEDKSKGLLVIPDTSRQSRLAHEQGLYAALLRVPGVVETGSNRLLETDWPPLRAVALAAVDKLNDYRAQEGRVMAADLAANCRRIADLLAEVDEFEEARIQSVRDRMEKHLADYLGRGNVDKNRYEQEILFYLEKMDINEEKVRLNQNCNYFLEVLENDKRQKGRKLNFISQEIGREVNTLGAKAYSADIQRRVVNMKEQLEMIKEQLANVA